MLSYSFNSSVNQDEPDLGNLSIKMDVVCSVVIPSMQNHTMFNIDAKITMASSRRAVQRMVIGSQMKNFATILKLFY